MMNANKIKNLLKKATKEQKNKAYEQAKAETLLKYPTMVEFFRFIERQNTAQKSGAETPLKSDNKKE